MNHFKIDQELLKNKALPDFSITINHNAVTSLYSDAELQEELIDALYKSKKVQVFDYTEDLYMRLSIEENLKFYLKWFHCKTHLVEILVLFQLHLSAKKPLRKCTPSEKRRVYYAKQFVSCLGEPIVFLEPIHGVDTLTIDTFFTLLREIKKKEIVVFILVTNMEHALLLGDKPYRLQSKGLYPIEIEDEGSKELEKESATKLSIHNLSKIPAKMDDKVILFDPLEIDYIESQDGKPYIIINKDSFILDSTLSDIEKKLTPYGFYRCHRSYIVNLQKVREIITWSKNTYSLRIDNQVQSTIPLSRNKIQEIQGIFSLK